MGKKRPSAPTPPDPAATAAAQSKANIETAQAQQKLNMVGSYGPDGSVSWRADPNSPGGYSQYTELSPGQQSLYDLGNSAQQNALRVANDQIIRVNGALQQPLYMPGLKNIDWRPSFDKAPDAPTFDRLQGGPDYQQSFDYDGAQRRLDPRYDDSGAVMAAQYGQAASRLDPMWQHRQDRLETQLANQGLDRNSTAYQTAMGDFGRDRNDAYNQAIYSAIGTGADRQNQLFGQGLSAGQFYNQGVGQDYAQNLGAAQFLNQALAQGYGDYVNQNQVNNQYAQQEYGNAYQNANFDNNWRQQDFNNYATQTQFNNETANQHLQNQAYVQNQPLNQFNSLMSSSQVSMPQGFGYTPSSVAGTNVAGIYNQDYQNRLGAYQTQMQNRSSMLGGLFGLGGAILGGPIGGQIGSAVGGMFGRGG